MVTSLMILYTIRDPESDVVTREALIADTSRHASLVQILSTFFR